MKPMTGIGQNKQKQTKPDLEGQQIWSQKEKQNKTLGTNIHNFA